jgi:Flp pilus assembly pilin Flp
MYTMLIIKLFRAALTDDKGVASMEYALLAVGILTGLAAAIAAVATKLDPIFSTSIVGLL